VPSRIARGDKRAAGAAIHGATPRTMLPARDGATLPACNVKSRKSRRAFQIAEVVVKRPFEEWISVFGSERLTGALLDRLTHHVHILQLNGESYRLKASQARQRRARAARQTVTAGPQGGDLNTNEAGSSR
jgi:hypothetical protein